MFVIFFDKINVKYVIMVNDEHKIKVSAQK